MSLKALTDLVNRRLDRPKPFSEETITRALDQLYAETQDRRYERTRRKRRTLGGALQSGAPEGADPQNSTL